ncbi:ATP-grasp domain-containing protein [Actinomadura sp. CNU-125]|uniref:ATP-grasp domain-containing protein n=1 Tax=Actinomadura sp. CNU-125 TaxID=1904961 RepID=UPI0021CC9E4A|nr:ATP-grasp domain-containing protein [Actinomadura sp. CNU-125]
MYGGEAFAAEVAAALDVALLAGGPGWLPGLPAEFTGRRVRLGSLGEARALDRPAFVKPASGKAFPPGVHEPGPPRDPPRDLPHDLPDSTPVLLADPVTFAGEYRLHVLDGAVHAASRYLLHGVLDAAPLGDLPERAAVEAFAADLLARAAPGLPSAVVVDVGLITAPGPPRYAVVEANEAWFSNCYAAPPERVLDVVLRAAAPRTDLARRVEPFVRR